MAVKVVATHKISKTIVRGQTTLQVLFIKATLPNCGKLLKLHPPSTDGNISVAELTALGKVTEMKMLQWTIRSQASFSKEEGSETRWWLGFENT